MKSTLDNVQHQFLVKMSELRTEHNRMIPFHRLPIELFARIISTALKPLQNLRWNQSTYLRRLVILCEVCKQWRDVINGTASLWAAIDILDPPALTSAAISRTAGHPLDVIAAPSGPINVASYLPDGLDEFTKTAMALSTRWRSIQIVVPSAEEALAIMNAHAPLLRSLELKSTTTFRLNLKKGGTLFQGTGPQLRRLALHGVAIPWDSKLPPDLRYLSISRLDPFSPSCEEILGIFRACSGLVELDLNLAEVATTTGRKNETPVRMAELQSLSLTLSTPCALTLLETIRLPSVQSVSLDLYCGSDTGLPFPHMIKHVQALFPVVFAAPYKLLITLLDRNAVSWTCKPSGGHRDGRDFAITVRDTPARDTLQHLIKALLNRFPAEFVEINFDGPLNFDLSNILWVFDRVYRIRNIMASSCNIDPLFRYMSDSTTSGKWGLPELQGIAVYDCHYSPLRLLSMIEARYEFDEEPESDASGGDERKLPPPLKWLKISHAPGEADEAIFGFVIDIIGPDCFEFHENVER
ncbi:hypothetical protein M407DRAFT_32448 [Tulasnella calospora MUT 4182]|uniref:Uncharacterized protein n=1 Tax=Tulasnella calospora MUT 4182 TaxID=1051891 RepID=A0A0C3L8W7_9AGAM|nr:hypothetical protein M407DRAFT_32448 [Tulasnella calospora MUT 4182]